MFIELLTPRIAFTPLLISSHAVKLINKLNLVIRRRLLPKYTSQNLARLQCAYIKVPLTTLTDISGIWSAWATAADTVRIFAIRAHVTPLSWVYLRVYGQFCNGVILAARVDRWIRNRHWMHADTCNVSLHLDEPDCTLQIQSMRNPRPAIANTDGDISIIRLRENFKRRIR